LGAKEAENSFFQEEEESKSLEKQQTSEINQVIFFTTAFRTWIFLVS
jgi:hypothetical protein